MDEKRIAAGRRRRYRWPRWVVAAGTADLRKRERDEGERSED